jgi:hypothetical protein
MSLIRRVNGGDVGMETQSVSSVDCRVDLFSVIWYGRSGSIRGRFNSSILRSTYRGRLLEVGNYGNS